MNTRSVFLFSLFLSVISFQVSATGLWFNQADGFGANFPETPTRTEAATHQASGYAYQSSKIFDNGGALYSITVVAMPPKISNGNVNEFLVELNSEFIKSMGQSPSKAKVKLGKFGDGRTRLNYEFDFQHDGAPILGKGFWIADKERVIRVSVSYTKNLKNHDAREAVHFLDSFALLVN